MAKEEEKEEHISKDKESMLVSLSQEEIQQKYENFRIEKKYDALIKEEARKLLLFSVDQLDIELNIIARKVKLIEKEKGLCFDRSGHDAKKIIEKIKLAKEQQGNKYIVKVIGLEKQLLGSNNLTINKVESLTKKVDSLHKKQKKMLNIETKKNNDILSKMLEFNYERNLVSEEKVDANDIKNFVKTNIEKH